MFNWRETMKNYMSDFKSTFKTKSRCEDSSSRDEVLQAHPNSETAQAEMSGWSFFSSGLWTLQVNTWTPWFRVSSTHHLKSEARKFLGIRQDHHRSLCAWSLKTSICIKRVIECKSAWLTPLFGPKPLNTRFKHAGVHLTLETFCNPWIKWAWNSDITF